MKLREIYNCKEKNKPVISFEVFPPKNGNENLFQELANLKQYNPALISVTSSASVTNLAQNELVTQIHDNFSFNVMPHITCVRNCKCDIENYLTDLKYSDCILALRGDMPTDNTTVCKDFKYANELVEYIKSVSDISIGVAGYPEGHIESPSLDADIENLKKKLDAGADVIFTQLFFAEDLFFKYVEKVRNAGINVPIVPGIMPVMSYKQICRMTSLANIFVPDEFAQKINKYKNDSDAMKEYGIEFASVMCKKLLENGVDALHFYTLNKAWSVSKILENIL